MGAWVEIRWLYFFTRCCTVAPCVGAWVEMAIVGAIEGQTDVAPCVGAWVEMIDRLPIVADVSSPPVWGRGLKYC